MALEIPEKVLAGTGLSISFIVSEIKIIDLLSQWPLLCAEENFDYCMFGGTAVNKAYLDQPRFSEDVDFFVYGKSVREVDVLIRKINGFKVNPAERIFGQMYRWRLEYYADEYNLSGKVDVDVNLNFKEKKTVCERKELKSFLSSYGFLISRPRVNVMPLEALVAQKLIAVKNRGEGKDYYDLYRVLSVHSFSKTRVLEEAYKYSKSLFDFNRFDENLIENVIESIKRMDENTLSAYNAYILKPFRPADWKALKKDLARLIKTKIQ